MIILLCIRQTFDYAAVVSSPHIAKDSNIPERVQGRQKNLFQQSKPQLQRSADLGADDSH